MFKREVDISILVMCDANDSTGYDRRNPELSNAPLHTNLDGDIIE
jgi:hypothetical protein